MNTPLSTPRPPAGHTLLELIGTISILTLLICALLPKVTGTIEDSRITADVLSAEAMRAATETYFQQYGRLAGLNGAAITTWSYNAYEEWDDNVLLTGNFAETTMRSKLATNAYVRLVRVSTTSTTADVLSDVGQVGRLPGFNCNNGFYNMMRQYTATRPATSDGPFYATARTPGRRAATGMMAVSGSLRELPGLGQLLGSGDGHGWPGTRWPSWQPRSWTGLNRVWQALGRVLNDGPGPIRGCYPVPPNWPEPPPGIGGGGGDPGDPRHDDPRADTQIVAADSSRPAIVAEIVLQGVTVQDAYRLSLAIDGPSQSNWAFFDSLGRVKYDMYDHNGGTKVGIVFIYLAHK